uniref:Lipoprotein n=1 Tax=Echinococcus granulosus TaxID=6210 RepID=A0A068W806_ECHGR|nr:hypothetical protein EgrG_000795800 [Echinococcus granulosus]
MSFTQSSRSNSLYLQAEVRRDGKCDFNFVSGTAISAVNPGAAPPRYQYVDVIR